MKQSELLAIACNLLKGQEKSRALATIGFGFGFACHWLKNKSQIFLSIAKRRNYNRVIIFKWCNYSDKYKRMAEWD